MKKYRDCGSEIFNTGSSKCPFVPDYVKVIILTPEDMVIKDDELEESLEEMIHANRPGRIYPIGPIAEYAPSGGEAQTSKQGYGPSQITSYSELVEVWTLENYDEGLLANLMKLKNERMRALFIDKNNVVYGQHDTDTTIKGYLMSSIYPSSVQRFKTSGDNATMAVSLVYDNVEKAWIETKSLQSETDLIEKAKGLVWVDVVKVGDSGSNYKVVEHYGKYDLTTAYGALLAKTEGVWEGVSAAQYNAADGTLNLTSDGTPALLSPEQLLTAGIKGIEQWKS
jgi:hypothetical protein|nr:MAG TPA: hypothetical protein [Caudoviricetes sp.]